MASKGVTVRKGRAKRGLLCALGHGIFPSTVSCQRGLVVDYTQCHGSFYSDASKVDDEPPNDLADLVAFCWTVGVAISSSFESFVTTVTRP